MRLDLYLKITRLVPRRSGAGDLCREGGVTVNGRQAKASRPLRVGDRIGITLPGRERRVEVLALPEGRSVPKKEAGTYYALLEERRFDLWGHEIAPRDI